MRTKVGAILASAVLLSYTAFAQNVTLDIPGSTGLPPCDALISANLTNRVLLATSDGYEASLKNYFSANGRLRPWCLVLPHSAEEVASTVRALREAGPGAGDWHIALRSGGHGPPGSNNIANGVTIDLSKMNTSSYDPTTGLASVEPGGQWKNVYANLLEHGNVTVVGGRDGGVGVGGFLLGGGNSYYSGREGFGCDTVVNFEVVLSNGTIVNANATSNADLWKALKGGGSNFGIVTRFDIEAQPAIDVAHGQSFLSANYSDQVIDAVVEFTDKMAERKDDHMFAVFVHTPGEFDDGFGIMYVRANTKGDINTSSFDRFTEIPTLGNATWSRKSLAQAAEESQVAYGSKNVGATLTVLNDAPTLRHAATLYSTLMTNLNTHIGPTTYFSQMFFQPLPTSLTDIANQKGGNVLGLSTSLPANGILWTAGVGILPGVPDSDAAVEIARVELNRLVEELKAFSVERGTDSGFLYLNYAFLNQDPLGSYGGESVGFLKEVARRWDGEGFWQERMVGGFKVSRVE